MKAEATTPRPCPQATGRLRSLTSDALTLALMNDDRIIVELVSDSDDSTPETIAGEVPVDIVAEFQCEV